MEHEHICVFVAFTFGHMICHMYSSNAIPPAFMAQIAAAVKRLGHGSVVAECLSKTRKEGEEQERLPVIDAMVGWFAIHYSVGYTQKIRLLVFLRIGGFTV